MWLWPSTARLDCTCWADPHQIQQLLRNLLINAMRYTHTGAPIELHATLDHDVVRLLR